MLGQEMVIPMFIQDTKSAWTQTLLVQPPEPTNGGAYHASKAAFNMIALREHYACVDKGLKVFTMSPGFVVWNLRGTSEEWRTRWGKAGPASVAGETLLNMLDSKRNADVGKFVYKDGVYD